MNIVEDSHGPMRIVQPVSKEAMGSNRESESESEDNFNNFDQGDNGGRDFSMDNEEDEYAFNVEGVLVGKSE